MMDVAGRSSAFVSVAVRIAVLSDESPSTRTRLHTDKEGAMRSKVGKDLLF